MCATASVVWAAILGFLFFISFSIFVILVDVVFSFLVSFSNISFFVILVDGSVCITGHDSRTCSCISIYYFSAFCIFVVASEVVLDIQQFCFLL